VNFTTIRTKHAEQLVNGRTALTGRSARRVGLRMLVLAAVLIISFVIAGNGRHAIAESLSCGISEITFSNAGGLAANFHSSISADGARIAFMSDRDLTGGNSETNIEIFLYDTTASSLTQITNTTASYSRDPSISADGKRIAFNSNGDFTGNNGDGNSEIFVYDTTTSVFTQITNTTGGINVEPSINGDGTRIAFVSYSNPTGGNPDGNPEIFLYDAATNSLKEVTLTPILGIHREPSISGDGTRIAFVSNFDLTGHNSDGNSEIFLFDTVTNNFTQVTDTFGGSQTNNRPSISYDGKRIAFDSSGFEGGNPDANTEIFVYDVATSGISQVTFTTGSFSGSPSINGDGTRIAFESGINLTGGNPDGNREIFLYDTTTHTFIQLSDTTSGLNLVPSLSDDGTHIAFSSTGFADLGNADGNTEIFLASCLTPQPSSSADLLISQSADKSSVKQGDTLTYTITVKNFGPNGAANVLVNDMLSSGSTFVNAHANKGTFNGPPVGQTGTVSWNLGNMPNGNQEAAQIKVTVIARGKASITNTATVSSDTTDPNTANNGASIITSVSAGSSGGKK
jgi:uncharacterized repeat protein (TIGR01451 family)